MRKLTVGLFNDSFPPIIDGVANAVVNYATVISRDLGRVVVATPKYPKSEENSYDFEVIRYKSAMMGKRIGYRAGNPFDPLLLTKLEKKKLDIIHTHCPFISAVLARVVRYYTGVPIVFTYHTKFDIDIDKRVKYGPVRKVSIKFILNNINACDEVWVVSNGAGENLKSLGYTGKYIVMKNGTDFKPGKASIEDVESLKKEYNVKDDEAVFLFVGRMMWYKGVKLIVDGLKLAKEKDSKFKMFFVGDGFDKEDIMNYVHDNGLDDNCIFTGAVRDREKLRTFFSMADLFLFPSDYDTNGIVVTEAAACSCPSLLLRGSCAAEGIDNYKNGIIIDKKPKELAMVALDVINNREKMKEIGENALEDIYLSWDEAVKVAYIRYEEIVMNHKVTDTSMPTGEMLLRQVRGVKSKYNKTKLRVKRKVKKGIANIFPKV